MKEVDMWTDGSSIKKLPEGFHGGAGCVLIYKGNEKHLSVSIEGGTNNIAELSAPLIGLRELKEKCKVRIHTDSAYTINCMTKWCRGWKLSGWKTSSGLPVKNADLIKELDILCNYHVVEWVKVKGHSGIYYNEVADQLATKASASLRGENE